MDLNSQYSLGLTSVSNQEDTYLLPGTTFSYRLSFRM